MSFSIATGWIHPVPFQSMTNRSLAQFLSGFEAGHRKLRVDLEEPLAGVLWWSTQSNSCSVERKSPMEAMAEQENSVVTVTGLPDSTWTVARLRDYLRDHGGRLAGKKAELLER